MKNYVRVLFVFAALFLLIFTGTHAQSLNVPADAPSIYISTAGSDASTGLTASTAMRNINSGILRAQASGIAFVKIVKGDYTEAIELRNGVHVIGGFSAEGFFAPDTNPVQVFAAPASNGQTLALNASGINARTYLSDLKLIGQDAPVKDAYTAYILNSSGVIMQRVIVTGGNGHDGADGIPGVTGPSGPAANGGAGANGASDSSCGNNNRGQGGFGGSGVNAGGRGGDGGTAGCYLILSSVNPTSGLQGSPSSRSAGGPGGSVCNQGAPGQPGFDGFPGGPGGNAGSTFPASLVGNFWSGANNGLDGFLGSDGSGGGGGGGAGGCRDLPNAFYGSGGGGGGAGGAHAAAAGHGGIGGGSSFGIFAVNSVVQTFHCSIGSGTGGKGGRGGSGAPGQLKGFGGSGGGGPGGGNFGGAGGNGGNGGSSGSGGSGAGGHSIGAYLADSSVLIAQESDFTSATAGVGGVGAGNGVTHNVFPSLTAGTVDALVFQQSLTLPGVTTIGNCADPLLYSVQASSGLPVTISTTSPIATIQGNYITFSGSGTVVISITQAGNNYYLPVATTATLQVSCPKTAQTISFDPLSPVTTGTAPFALTATASSGLPVQYSIPVVTPPLISITNNIVTVLTSGTITITATQDGNTNFSAAVPVSQTLTITNSTDCFGYSVAAFNQGKTKQGTAIEARRSNPELAFGAPQDNDTYNFVSLGFGGSITLELAQPLYNTNGYDPDFIVVETSFGRADEKCFAGGNTFNYPETIVIEVSDGTTWRSLPDSYCRTSFVDISSVIDAQFVSVRRIRLRDFSNKDQFDNTADGFDVDGLIVCPDAVRAAFTQYTNVRLSESAPAWDPAFFNRAPNEATDASNSLSVYPNPVNGDYLKIEYVAAQQQSVEIAIFDTKGLRVTARSENVYEGVNTFDLNVTSYVSGAYVVRLLSRDAVETKKFVKF